MLRRLDEGAYGKVEELFRDFAPHRGHWGSALRGAAPGEVLADSAEEPRAALVRPDDGFAYIACRGDPAAFAADCRGLFARESAEAAARGEGSCLELVTDDPALESRVAEFFGDLPWFAVPRLLFRAPAAPPAPSAPPPGALPRRLREGRGIGVVLEMEGREAGCARTMTYGGEAEVDIEVEEPFRGRGLGRLLGAELLRFCADEGLAARWTCWEDKEESRRLAERLGFILERRFMVYIHDSAEGAGS